MRRINPKIDSHISVYKLVFTNITNIPENTKFYNRTNEKCNFEKRKVHFLVFLRLFCLLG